ncbi:hypothetical protein [Taklimakanibacter deserti]|uniref:hypothetical protein n=1 Tax=Taklimakanibacter deserti TaxID=2267839 RepID=UPI000E647423
MPRPMSFSDSQHFFQGLAECRILAVARERGEHHDSALRKRCEGLIAAVDGVAGELVGYLNVVDHQARA